MNTISRSFLVAVILVSCVGCDQATKAVATDFLYPSRPISYLGDTFRLHYTENIGAFMGLGSTMSPGIRFWLLIILTGTAVIGMLVFVLIHRGLRTASVIGLSLVIGGGIGNLIDRIMSNGAVIDFMNIGIGSLRTGIFNFADVAIMAGTATLFFSASRSDNFTHTDCKGEMP
jgi:signal peptidase II